MKLERNLDVRCVQPSLPHSLHMQRGGWPYSQLAQRTCIHLNDYMFAASECVARAVTCTAHYTLK